MECTSYLGSIWSLQAWLVFGALWHLKVEVRQTCLIWWRLERIYLLYQAYSACKVLRILGWWSQCGWRLFHFYKWFNTWNSQALFHIYRATQVYIALSYCNMSLSNNCWSAGIESYHSLRTDFVIEQTRSRQQSSCTAAFHGVPQLRVLCSFLCMVFLLLPKLYVLANQKICNVRLRLDDLDRHPASGLTRCYVLAVHVLDQRIIQSKTWSNVFNTLSYRLICCFIHVKA